MEAVWQLTVVTMIVAMAADIATVGRLNAFKHRNGHLVAMSIFGIVQPRVRLAEHLSLQANLDMDAI